MLRTSFILILFCVYSCALAQFKNFNTEENIWREGVIKLEDGEVIESELNYNFVSGVLKLRQTENESGTIYSPNKVLYFEFNEGRRKVLFYSLPYDFEGSGHLTPAFFEVVYRIGDDVILSRHEMEFKQKNVYSVYSVPGRDYSLRKRKEKVFRIIYIATSGGIYPVLNGKVDVARSFTFGEGINNKTSLSYKENSKFETSTTEKEEINYKSILREDLEVLFPEGSYEIENFIKDNKIDMDEVEDWKSIIDFKNQLTK